MNGNKWFRNVINNLIKFYSFQSTHEIYVTAQKKADIAYLYDGEYDI